MSRLRPTLIDYVLVAINPALIMVLIGSLVFFLLEMFYQGEYPARLHYCLASFVFGVVLIARISMEQGWERAAPFGAALAIVVAMAMHRFVSYEGSPLAPVGWIINYTLMGITWWCAHKLTWDCTLVDESQDASGEGLLQTVGLQSRAPDAETATAPKPESGDPASIKAVESPARQSWRERFLERRRRPHAPGVWVVYFSLAALPIFGVGQAFIPAANTVSRRYAFLLLCVYVAAALALLMTTSFLGLRRYLRQRRLEMPVPMAGTWLATGSVIIVALLVLTALLPRPAAEYSISQLPLRMTSSHRDPSQVAVGKEGSRDDKQGRQQAESSTTSQDAKFTGSQTDSNLKDSGRPAGEPSDDGKAAGKSEENKATSGKSTERQSDTSQSSDVAKPDKRPEKSPAEERSEKPDGKIPSSQSPRFEPPPVNLHPPTTVLAKWIFYGALVLLALWWSWRHRRELMAWFVEMWRDFWGLLFGRRRDRIDTTPAPARKKSFLEYQDPFATGMYTGLAPNELIRYSFEAFEAWARDNGWPRDPDQTAYEFARRIGERSARLAGPARGLADLYSRAAYAPGSLPDTTVEELRAFWQALQLEAFAGTPFPVVTTAC